jgi:hypothetical protein
MKFDRYAWKAGMIAALGLALSPAAFGQDATRFAVELEAGPVWQSSNDVQIPNDADGTRFSLVDLAGYGPWPAGRLYLTWNINERHGLRALAAPLSFTETGILQEPVDFAGATYLPGVPTEATYQFDSYRLTYRYRLHSGDRWTWWIGGTAKVRDAKIELQQGGVTSQDTDLGFVPLLHLAADWRLAERWRLVLDLDALAGGPGRAEDFAAKLAYDLNDRWLITAGYRTVEGGADTDDVYSFGWFHYAVVSGIYRF